MDWQKRIEALARCEGIVLGGGAQWGNFAEVLRNQLRDLLSLQIGDRCALQPVVTSCCHRGLSCSVLQISRRQAWQMSGKRL